MSQICHVCGPVKHECPTVMCAPCLLEEFRKRWPIEATPERAVVADTSEAAQRTL